MRLNKSLICLASLAFGAGILLAGCSRSSAPLNSMEAKLLAMQRLEKQQNFWCYDARRLPPLRMAESANQYVFTVKDPKQNVFIVISVYKTGMVVESATDLNLEEAAENGKNVVLRRTKTHCSEPDN